MRNRVVVLALAAVVCSCGPSSKQQGRFQTLDGFTVEVAAKPEQTGSLVAMTFDSLGRPVVAKERGSPTTLIDKDGDGYFETEKPFTDKVVRCQGLWFDGRTLYAIGNDAEEKKAGLYKLEDTNRDDWADTFERLNLFDRGMGEHGPHDMRRGPDGVPTIMLGNHTSVAPELIDPNSPLAGCRENQLLTRYNDARGHAADIMCPGGVLTRFDLSTRKYTYFAGGFRNAYNHAWNLDGEAFTFDSDMEWDINLPWYRAVRTVHVIPGGDYGWRTGSGKLPAYHYDTLPPVRDLGRGSPVGVEFYQHDTYGKPYRDAFLEGDWSRGRILITRLERSGATYRAADTRELVHGEPLNVTDLEVGPDGFIYFTMGGRDTEGGFYRIRHTPGFFERLFTSKKAVAPAIAAVRQPQPLSSWGHAALLKRKSGMGAAWPVELEKIARDGSADSADRVQAALILQRIGPAPSPLLLTALAADADAMVRATAVFLAGVQSNAELASGAIADKEGFVRRRAAEALLRMNQTSNQAAGLMSSSDRFESWAGRLLYERQPVSLKTHNPVTEYAKLRVAKSEAGVPPILEASIESLKAEASLDNLRLFQLAAMSLKNGAPAEIRKRVHDILAPKFPVSKLDEPINRELARTLAYCNQPEAIAEILAAMPKEDENKELQLHYAYCLRDIKGVWTPEQKRQFTNWLAKGSEWRGGASFTGYINLMFDSVVANAQFTEDEKKTAWAKIPAFAPLAEGPKPNRNGFIPSAAVVRRSYNQAMSPQEIMEFQLFDPMTLRASAEKGAQVFEKECSSCHRFGAAGKDFGPDLTTLTSRFKKKDVLESILWPSKTISDQYQSFIIETKDGELVNGLLVSEDAKKLVVKTAQVERPIEIPKSAVKDRRLSKISIMPEDLLAPYGMGDVSNLMAYIMKGAKK